jgi:hypothetical protein
MRRYYFFVKKYCVFLLWNTCREGMLRTQLNSDSFSNRAELPGRLLNHHQASGMLARANYWRSILQITCSYPSWLDRVTLSGFSGRKTCTSETAHAGF